MVRGEGRASVGDEHCIHLHSPLLLDSGLPPSAPCSKAKVCLERHFSRTLLSLASIMPRQRYSSPPKAQRKSLDRGVSRRWMFAIRWPD